MFSIRKFASALVARSNSARLRGKNRFRPSAEALGARALLSQVDLGLTVPPPAPEVASDSAGSDPSGDPGDGGPAGGDGGDPGSGDKGGTGGPPATPPPNPGDPPVEPKDQVDVELDLPS